MTSMFVKKCIFWQRKTRSLMLSWIAVFLLLPVHSESLGSVVTDHMMATNFTDYQLMDASSGCQCQAMCRVNISCSGVSIQMEDGMINCFFSTKELNITELEWDSNFITWIFKSPLETMPTTISDPTATTTTNPVSSTNPTTTTTTDSYTTSSTTTTETEIAATMTTPTTTTPIITTSTIPTPTTTITASTTSAIITTTIPITTTTPTTTTPTTTTPTTSKTTTSTTTAPTTTSTTTTTPTTSTTPTTTSTTTTTPTSTTTSTTTTSTTPTTTTTTPTTTSTTSTTPTTTTTTPTTTSTTTTTPTTTTTSTTTSTTSTTPTTTTTTPTTTSTTTTTPTTTTTTPTSTSTTPTTTTTTTTTTTPVECNNYETGFKNSCYFIWGMVSWSDAVDACEMWGTTLVKISNTEEFDFIKNKIYGNTWIGLNDINSEGTFKWSDGSSYMAADLASWENGQQNNDATKDCVYYSYDDNSLWKMSDCGTSMHFVCERTP